MPFSDKIRFDVKKMASFHCCWCQQIKGTLDAHHIIPEEENGPSTIDNAAPLCKECHDTYGSNSSKRAELRQRRDFWYEHCKHLTVDPEIIQKIYEEMASIKKAQTSSQEEIKEEIKKVGSDMAKIVSNRITEIGHAASQGQYPNWDSFSNAMITASGTTAAVFENIHSPFLEALTFSASEISRTSPTGLFVNSKKFVRCECGSFIEIDDSKSRGIIFSISNQVKCPKCGRIVRFSS